MARPRFTASVLAGVGVVSSFRGMFARVARKLKVSPSMVSRVAGGHRIFPYNPSCAARRIRSDKGKMQYLSEGGLTTKEIAARIRISPNTVKSFLRSIMLKMGVTTRSGIVGKAIATKFPASKIA
jgi:hypothetical protein